MEWHKERGVWILQSGRVLPCGGFAAVLSVAIGDRDYLYHGYDSEQDLSSIDEDGGGPLTDAERLEIANYQIGLWLAWAKPEVTEKRAEAERAAEPSPLRGPEWPHLEVR